MLFIDTETTGLPRKAPGAKKYNHRNVQGFDSARIVSIAWIYENEHGKHDHYFLIKPENFEIPDEAAAIHGYDGALRGPGAHRDCSGPQHGL